MSSKASGKTIIFDYVVKTTNFSPCQVIYYFITETNKMTKKITVRSLGKIFDYNSRFHSDMYED